MFSQRFKNLRLSRDLSQSSMAKILSVSPSTIGMYEQGRREPDSDTLMKISSFFCVSIDYLLGNEELKDEMPEFLILHRNAKSMTPDQRKRMMTILKASFDHFDWDDE